MNDQNNVRILSDKTLIKRLMVYMKGHYKTFIIAFTLMVIAVGFDVSLPLLVNLTLKELAKDVINFNNIILTFFYKKAIFTKKYFLHILIKGVERDANDFI